MTEFDGGRVVFGQDTTSPEDAAVSRIRERAYRIWETEGWPVGRDVEHWLRAEREILGDER